MRRLTFAALAAALVLAGCSDQSTESPTEPSVPTPDQTVGSTCTVAPFPLQTVSAQILEVFPNGRLRIEATARAAGIKLFWDTCHEGPARQMAVSFIEWMNENFIRGKLRGATAEEVQTLTITILGGVGVPVDAPASEGDIGVGIYDGEKTLIKTASEVALTEIEADAFADGEPRLIVVKRLVDNFRLSNFGGNQFEPFFDYDATKLEGTTTDADKILASGKFAIIAFCLFPPPFTYPDNVGIGHNPVEGALGFPFEILPAVNLPVERPDLVEELNCGELEVNPGPIIGGRFDSGLPGWVNVAGRTARRLLVPLASNVLLPEPLWATAAVGFLGPIGGKTTSLSPFGTVEVGETDVDEVGSPQVGDEEAGPYFVGQPLDACNEGCYPEFQILRNETVVQTPTSITVTLVPGEGSTGTLSGIKTKLTSATEPFTAIFDDLTISAPGSYQLVVSAAGSNSYTTGVFTVSAPPIPTAFAPLGAGGFHTCAVKTDGTVTCWGDDSQDQTSVPEGLTGAMAVSTSSAHNCALRNDATVICWGRSSEGQTTVPVGLTGVAAVGAGGIHTCALKGDGTVTCWGALDFFAPGTDPGVTTVPAGLAGVVRLSVGSLHTCAVRSNGTLSCWGSNDKGQTIIPAGLTNVVGVGASNGGEHTCAVRSDGGVSCWGLNNSGQATVPAGLSGVTAVGGGVEHSCALKSDGTVTCWGDNSLGQTSVPAGLTGVTYLSVGNSHNCVLKSDGSVTCWGWNNAGQSDVPAGLNLGGVIG